MLLYVDHVFQFLYKARERKLWKAAARSGMKVQVIKKSLRDSTYKRMRRYPGKMAAQLSLKLALSQTGKKSMQV